MQGFSNLELKTLKLCTEYEYELYSNRKALLEAPPEADRSETMTNHSQKIKTFENALLKFV